MKKIAFLGSKKLGLLSLHSLLNSFHKLATIVTIDDRGDSRSCMQEFDSIAEKRNIPFYCVKNKRESEAVLNYLLPDLCIVIGWYWIIPKHLLERIPLGFIGVHNSLLPKYRGGSPLVWQIINGENETGFSVFSLAEGMDEGDLWAQETIEITQKDYILDVLQKIERRVPVLIEEITQKLIDGVATPTKQDHTKASYCFQRTPEDGIINWSKSALDVYNFIRAQSLPYPGAFSTFSGKKIHIWKAKPSSEIWYGKTGQLVRFSGDNALILCGDRNCLEIELVGFEGEFFTPKIFGSRKVLLGS